jgi:hypothetical protein
MSATPVNIALLRVKDTDLSRLGQIKELQIFGQGNNFHPDGLFSTTIFGAVGSEHRTKMFGYIDLRYNALHPLVYKTICSLKSFYKGILDGTTLAVWNPKLRQFDKSSDTSAQTGFTFFLKHIREIRFEPNQSDKRNENIKFFDKAVAEDKYLMRYLLVMPAGLRDYTITPNGKPEEDEVNTFYRRILAQSQLVDIDVAKRTPHVYDNVYSNLQNSLMELYDYLQTLLDGKHKLILGKWLSRKIFNSTRNVITASVSDATHIGDANRLRSNNVGVGMHQFLRAAAPKTLYEIRSRYVQQVFVENNTFAYMTNCKTLQKEEVLNSHVQKDYDRWMTTDGLESVIANFARQDLRHLPVYTNKGKHCMGLLYNDGKHVRFFQDIRELPDHLDKGNVSPITMAEFLYLSVGRLSGKIPAFATRYPIQGYGGIYPAFMKLYSTAKYIQVQELDEQWQPIEGVLHSFPVRGSDFINGLIIHQSHMALLGSDFDGDTMSLQAVLSDEAVEEITKLLSSKSYYLDNERKISFSNSTDILEASLAFMTA